ncbi:hypothetical protein NXW11_11185 [Bacteroides thetaiotaomicron]|jgi:MORN motif|uniref:hypothetical protein n=1 Tax=Bacteroides thetaiotaomicron TaxID=818 RepID=UPI000E47D6B8|nr:hypothetical protein [Bacteroides thetaiotaomicron]MCS2618500.1 hypothetical protein [Bacteroides thetaiotaomicron]RHI37813.1 hypothetical protein DW167_22850 [Bacteroides thetaiotaomicron]
MKKYILFLLPLFLGLLVSNDIEAKKKKYPNGDRYEGEWKDGVPNGNGKMTYASGGIYIGNWLSGNKHGEGKMTYANGDCYEGNWSYNNKQGNGKMTYTSGDIYIGNWASDNKHGNGKTTYANGDCYEGNWNLGKRKGIGTMTYANGNCYKGNWEDGHYDDNGIMKYANGDVYEGEWKLEKPSGIGRMAYANGDIYEGSWRMGVRDGNGTITYTNGDSFECNYSNGILVSGILSRNNGDQYTAKWFDYKSGKGTIKYKNGDVYVGDFKDLLPDGEGKLTDEDGLEKNGIWEKGILKDGKEERKGIYGIYTWNIKEGEANDTNIITLENGGIYKGEIQNDLPSGHGTFSIPQGSELLSLDGYWEDGKIVKLERGKFMSNIVTLKNGMLSIPIEYSNGKTEIKSFACSSFESITELLSNVTTYIARKEQEEKLVFTKKYIQGKTFNGEVFFNTELQMIFGNLLKCHLTIRFISENTCSFEMEGKAFANDFIVQEMARKIAKKEIRKYYYTGEYIQLGDENAEGEHYFFINNNTALKWEAAGFSAILKRK